MRLRIPRYQYTHKNLANTVIRSIEAHVKRFQPFLSDDGSEETWHCVVIFFYCSGGLNVAKFLQCDQDRDGILTVMANGGDLGLCS